MTGKAWEVAVVERQYGDCLLKMKNNIGLLKKNKRYLAEFQQHIDLYPTIESVSDFIAATNKGWMPISWYHLAVEHHQAAVNSCRQHIREAISDMRLYKRALSPPPEQESWSR